MSDWLWAETKDNSSPVAFNSASVYDFKEVPTKQEGLEFNASKGDVDVASIYRHHKTLIQATIP
jgi:hypothetical protein